MRILGVLVVDVFRLWRLRHALCGVGVLCIGGLRGVRLPCLCRRPCVSRRWFACVLRCVVYRRIAFHAAEWMRRILRVFVLVRSGGLMTGPNSCPRNQAISRQVSGACRLCKVK